MMKYVPGLKFTFLAFLAAGCLTFFAAVKPAHALLILDDMIYIGSKAGAATFKAKNTSAEPKAYRLEWTQLRQTLSGPKDNVAPGEVIPGVMNAEPYMFLSPRRLIIQPDQLQHIRFMVRRTEGLAPGEYRSYLEINPEEIPAAYSGTEKETLKNPVAAAASMNILTGYRIPVFFLHGDTMLEMSVLDPRFKADANGTPMIEFAFNRSGTRSAIGDLNLMCLGGEQPVRVGRMPIKIFTELPGKRYNARVEMPPEGCASIGFDFLHHKRDPDYTGYPVRLAEWPLN